MSRKSVFIEEHGTPVSRREFIARGLAAGGGWALAPSLAGLLAASEAWADGQEVLRTPFLVFDLVGGAALPANFLVGKGGGPQDFLSSYDKLGWDPRATKLDARFGIPMAEAGVSKVFDGILSVLSSEAQAGFRMGSLLHTAAIDTSQNPLSAMSLVSRSGTVGTKIPRALGTRSTLSGANSRAAGESETFRPLYIQKIDDLIQSLGLTSHFSKFSDRSMLKLGDTLRKLSVSQLRRALGSSGDQAVLESFDQKHVSFIKNLKPPQGLDPRVDPLISKIYGITTDTAPNDVNVVRAGLVSAALKGLSGSAAIVIDGCDYHDGTQTTGDNKDREIGVEIGRAVEAARQLKVPVFIQVITDGGIYPQTGTRKWVGDSPETCMSVVGYYRPTRPSKYFQGRMQVGRYTEGQGADRSTLIGDSPLLAAYATFANYLQVSGRLGEFEKNAPGVFSKTQLESVLIFEG